MIRLAIVAALLAGCCKPPPPRPPVVTTDRSCLEGLEAPEELPLPTVACAGGQAVLCFDFRGAAAFAAQMAALYRYRDRVEARCRPIERTDP